MVKYAMLQEQGGKKEQYFVLCNSYYVVII